MYVYMCVFVALSFNYIDYALLKKNPVIVFPVTGGHMPISL